MFLVERDTAPRTSGLTGVYHDHNNHNDYNHNSSFYGNNNMTNIGLDGVSARAVAAHGQLTPPPDKHQSLWRETPSGQDAYGTDGPICAVASWMEIWDYAGGASFRAFVADDGTEKSLFVFFDASALGRDLKQALVALIELAEVPLGCSQMVICIDRSIPTEEAKGLTKGLQWAGFSLTTLDHWTGGLDTTSNRWLFMGMEL